MNKMFVQFHCLTLYRNDWFPIKRCQKVLRTMLDITVVYQSGQHCNKTDTPATQIVLISFCFRNTSYNILPL